MVNILLTFDYEIFGNGSGDVRSCLVKSTEKLLDLLDKYNIKATFFFEICTYWAFLEAEKNGALSATDFLPTKRLAQQVQEIAQRGHDIQLHVHPQMIGAKYRDGKFNVDLHKWRVADLSSDIVDVNQENTLYGILSRGKCEIEQLIRPILPEFQCLAFRAGALCARPEQNLLQMMKKVGLKIECSGAYEYHTDAWPSIVDYRGVFSKADPFFVGQSFDDRKKFSDLIALPVYGIKQNGRLFVRRLLHKANAHWQPQRPAGCQGNVQHLKRKSWLETKLRQLVNPIHFGLDGLKAPMIFCVEDALKRSKIENKTIFACAIGHPKLLGDLSQIEAFLSWCLSRQKMKPKLEFITVNQFAQQWFQNE